MRSQRPRHGQPGTAVDLGADRFQHGAAQPRGGPEAPVLGHRLLLGGPDAVGEAPEVLHDLGLGETGIAPPPAIAGRLAKPVSSAVASTASSSRARGNLRPGAAQARDHGLTGPLRPLLPQVDARRRGHLPCSARSAASPITSAASAASSRPTRIGPGPHTGTRAGSPGRTSGSRPSRRSVGRRDPTGAVGEEEDALRARRAHDPERQAGHGLLEPETVGQRQRPRRSVPPSPLRRGREEQGLGDRPGEGVEERLRFR